MSKKVEFKRLFHRKITISFFDSSTYIKKGHVEVQKKIPTIDQKFGPITPVCVVPRKKGAHH